MCACIKGGGRREVEEGEGLVDPFPLFSSLYVCVRVERACVKERGCSSQRQTPEEERERTQGRRAKERNKEKLAKGDPENTNDDDDSNKQPEIR